MISLIGSNDGMASRIELLSGNSEDECKITGRFENETLKVVSREFSNFPKRLNINLNDKEVKLLIKG